MIKSRIYQSFTMAKTFSSPERQVSFFESLLLALQKFKSAISRLTNGIFLILGFMGKVLVEKLLRDCSGLNCIYILIRNKRGMKLEKRCNDFLNHYVFDNLRSKSPEVLMKVQAVSGDVSVDGLEMDEQDYEMLIDKVNIVFHCAANVRFDQNLREAVNFNTVGTLRILKLAEQMKNLQVFLHVSTTYCHCKETILEERYYAASEDPFGIIEMVKVLKDDTINSMTSKLLDGLPNTYAFTKGLTEDMVHQYMDKFPIAIARPSIVIAAWKSPYKGWVEGLNGPTGLSVVAAKGVLRSMYCNPDFRSQTIPVDIVINVIIAIAYQRSKMAKGAEYYCNIADCLKTPLTWGYTIELSREIIKKYPMSQMIWYPDGSIKTNYYHHLICSILFHYLPAYVIDFMMILFRQKPL